MHVTIAYLGVPNEKGLSAFEELSQVLKYIKFNVIGHDLFGLEKNIPVLVLDTDERCDELLTNFYQKCGVKEPSQKEKRPKQVFHISLKNTTLEEMRKKYPLGYPIMGTKIGIKRLGPIDPFYCKKFEN